MRRGQHRVDRARERIRPGIAPEGVRVFGGGRQAEEVKGCAPKQRRPLRVWRRPQALRLPRRRDEAIDVGARPGVCGCRRNCRAHRRHKGPEAPALLDGEADLLRPRVCGHWRDGRARRATLHPFLQQRHLFARQRGLRRHRLEFKAGVADGLDQGALFRVAGHDRGAGFAALQPARRVIEAEPRLDFLVRRVALVTTLREQGPDLLFEELDVPGFRSAHKRSGQQRASGQREGCRWEFHDGVGKCRDGGRAGWTRPIQRMRATRGNQVAFAHPRNGGRVPVSCVRKNLSGGPCAPRAIRRPRSHGP